MASRTFTSDNAAGTAPEILAALAAANHGGAAPYGNDDISLSVKAQLSQIFERDVEFLITSTGSAANALSLATMLKPWQGVYCHEVSHINNDECGAVEFYSNGSKLITLPGEESRINPTALAHALANKVGDVHTIQPGAVTITQATETGSIYSLTQIQEISRLTKDAGLKLHMDGARFANALVSLGCNAAEMTWKSGVDILSFGATKNGTMTADAVVVFDKSLIEEMRYRHKRAGQLTAKMRFNAAQLHAYLKDDLWLRHARQSNATAALLREKLASLGFEVHSGSQSNITFVTLPQEVIEKLHAAGFAFYANRWAPGVCRLVTSFETTPEDIQSFIDCIA